MAQLIDKDAVVAEIDNRIQKCILLQQKPKMSDLQEELQNMIDCLNSIKGCIINTPKVKEVEYDKEVIEYLKNFENANIGYRLSLRRCAKRFFELGLKAQKGEEI